MQFVKANEKKRASLLATPNRKFAKLCTSLLSLLQGPIFQTWADLFLLVLAVNAFGVLSWHSHVA